MTRGQCARLWCVAFAVAVCATAPAQQRAAAPQELEAAPPPEGACAEDVVSHVLIEQIGSWMRTSRPIAGDMALTPALTGKLGPDRQQALATYDALCGAVVSYRNTEGPGTADVLMIAFERPLHALGFFATGRTGLAERVLLTSAAYRDGGALHVYSGNYYLRIQAHGAHEEALPSDQYIAARLELRLPPVQGAPRIIELMPRGWVNALTVGYEPTDLLGEELSPMAAGASKMVGDAQMRVRIMEAPDEATARRWYTALLQRSLERGRAWEVARLGDEAFYMRNGSPAVVMLEDRFLAHVGTEGARDDAVAIMRLVGTAIRITQPLPDDADGYCPPLRVLHSP